VERGKSQQQQNQKTTYTDSFTKPPLFPSFPSVKIQALLKLFAPFVSFCANSPPFVCFVIKTLPQNHQIFSVPERKIEVQCC
jgi:hypothetical protein